jgi:uncharacterized protein
MAARAFDPLRLEVAAFAREGGVLEGRWPVRTLARLLETAAPEARPSDEDDVAWRAQGETVPVAGAAPESWIRLDAEAPIAMTCQRCLAPVALRLEVRRRILFVPGEEAAARLDAEREEDVLALSHALDLRELVEDELLLAEPIVPLHGVCPQPLAYANDPAPLAGTAENPFAALQAMKLRGPAS